MLHGGYTQIMVNPMLLSDTEFTHWMEKLVEARKNWQERRPRPYRNYRKPYNNEQLEQRRPQLKNKMQPAHELDIQSRLDSKGYASTPCIRDFSGKGSHPTPMPLVGYRLKQEN